MFGAEDLEEVDGIWNAANYSPENEKPCIHEKHHEKLPVFETHAVIEPWTVVIHIEDALVAR